jgi:hypothetical protein
MEGYDFAATDLTTLLLRRFYPERTDRESTIIRDWLLEHGAEYDRFSFSVRVGEGQTPAPELEPGVARSVVFSSRKRIDVLAWQGNQPTIIEVKERVTPGALGQVLTYRQLFMQEQPDAPEPILKVIGRYSDDETIRALVSHGVEVIIYAAPQPS